MAVTAWDLCVSWLGRIECGAYEYRELTHARAYRCCHMQGTDADDEYMISDANLLVNKYVSVPRDMGHLNCGAYVAGIVKVRWWRMSSFHDARPDALAHFERTLTHT